MKHTQQTQYKTQQLTQLENTHPVYQIARSYTRNLQHEFCGGRKFEKSDFFSSHSTSFFCQPTEQEIQDISTLLYNRAVKDVNNAIALEKTKLLLKETSKEDKAKNLADEGVLDFDLALQQEEDETIPYPTE